MLLVPRGLLKAAWLFANWLQSLYGVQVFPLNPSFLALYVAFAARFVPDILHSRGLNNPLGSCPCLDSWVFTYGAHLRK